MATSYRNAIHLPTSMLTIKEKQESEFYLTCQRSRRVEPEFESAAAAACDARRSRPRHWGGREGSTVLGSEPADRPGSAACGRRQERGIDAAAEGRRGFFGDRESGIVD